MKKLGICLAFMICFSAFGYAKAEKATDECAAYTMESVLVNPDEYQGAWTWVTGYVNIRQNGIAIYYSQRDYVYETKECAIWLPEREEICVKDYVEMAQLKEGRNECVPIQFTKTAEKSEYGAVGRYLKMKRTAVDDISLTMSLDEKIEGTDARLFEKTEGETAGGKVSIYRVLGKPWAYHGKEIETECIRDTQERLFPNVQARQETGGKGIQPADTLAGSYKIDGEAVGSYWPDYETYCEKMVSQYGWGKDEYYKFGAIGAENYRILVHCKLYFSQNDRENRALFPIYQLMNMQVHEKDEAAFLDLVQR